jgi:hypothetical protein
MTFRLFKRIPLIPGLRVNISKSGPSLSIGHRGAWFTIGPRGKRVTVGGLGTGFYYTTRIPPAAAPRAVHRASFALIFLLLFFVALAMLA